MRGGGGCRWRKKKIWHEANFSSGRVRAPNGCGAPFTKNVSPTSSALTPRPLIFKSLPFPLGRGHATTHAYEVNGSERPRKVTTVRARGGGGGEGGGGSTAAARHEPSNPPRSSGGCNKHLDQLHSAAAPRSPSQRERAVEGGGVGPRDRQKIREIYQLYVPPVQKTSSPPTLDGLPPLLLQCCPPRSLVSPFLCPSPVRSAGRAPRLAWRF